MLVVKEPVEGEKKWSDFQLLLYNDLVYLFDGVCFLSFMLMHRSNFKEQKQQVSDNQNEDNDEVNVQI